MLIHNVLFIVGRAFLLRYDGGRPNTGETMSWLVAES